VTAHLEVSAPGGPRLVPLNDEPVTLGRGPGNHVTLSHDRTVSTLHAVIEPVGGGWCVRDIGSRNGTWLAGERIVGDRALHDGDELLLGHTRVVFRLMGAARADPTESADRPPELTRRERDVLVALCRPMFGAQVFSEPASLREIAAELVVSEAAVKQHLLHLYDKFALPDDTGRRRVLLANEAVRRGAVTLADLQRPARS
jgi:hypothetical protein